MFRVSRKSYCFSQHQLRLFVASKGGGCSPSASTFYVAVLPLVKYMDEGKCRRTAILAGIFCHARHEFGYQGRELDLCDGDGQRGDGATSVEPLVQPYNSVNFIELLPRFFATFSSSFHTLFGNIFIEVAGSNRESPKFAKRLDRRTICSALLRLITTSYSFFLSPFSLFIRFFFPFSFFKSDLPMAEPGVGYDQISCFSFYKIFTIVSRHVTR